MKQWSREIEIDAPIEHVWSYQDGTLEQMQKIMPEVLEHTPVHVTEEKVGSIHRQTVKEGDRVEQYDVHTLEYVNAPHEKRLKVAFTLADAFEIAALYEMWRIGDNKTGLKYTVTSHSLKWLPGFFLHFARDDEIVDPLLERVKKVAEAECRS